MPVEAHLDEADQERKQLPQLNLDELASMNVTGEDCKDEARAHRPELGLGREGLRSVVRDFPTVDIKGVVERRLDRRLPSAVIQ